MFSVIVWGLNSAHAGSFWPINRMSRKLNTRLDPINTSNVLGLHINPLLPMGATGAHYILPGKIVWPRFKTNASKYPKPNQEDMIW
jgi:hypothetical protein